MKNHSSRKMEGELAVITYESYRDFAKGRLIVGVVGETNKAGYIATGRFTASPDSWRRATLEDVLPFLEDGEQQVLAMAKKILESQKVTDTAQEAGG